MQPIENLWKLLQPPIGVEYRTYMVGFFLGDALLYRLHKATKKKKFQWGDLIPSTSYIQFMAIIVYNPLIDSKHPSRLGDW